MSTGGPAAHPILRPNAIDLGLGPMVVHYSVEQYAYALAVRRVD